MKINKFFTSLFLFLFPFFFLFYLFFFSSVEAANPTLLNVSYDPTRELYKEYNQLFTKHWLEKTGQKIIITQSHAGSGKQARSVIDGLKADVVTLALAYDIDAIAAAGLIDKNWQNHFANNSAAYSSTIVFLVRKNNPKNIKDWNDLIKKDVKIITPNPKTSGGARWNYLAAYGFALNQNHNDQKKAREFMVKLFANVPILDSGARAATTSFVERGIGDVLISWESDALLVVNKFGKDQFEIIIPEMSILAEPPIALVDKVVDKDGNRELANEYLKFLYTKNAQEIIAKNYFRPIDKEIAKKYSKIFPKIKLLTIKDFGGWDKVQKQHFSDGGMFDQIIVRK